MHYESLKAYFLKHAELTPNELDIILEHYKEKRVAKGDFVLREGEICRFEGYVVEGCFKICVTDEKGVEFKSEKCIYLLIPIPKNQDFPDGLSFCDWVGITTPRFLFF